MARKQQSVEINTFVKGLITEASPLTFPDNASINEDNFVLKRDGSRERRLGIDYEAGFQKIDTGITNIPSGELAFSTYTWKNAGGNAAKSLVIVQTGKRVDFFDVDITPLSSGLSHTQTFSQADEQQVFSYAVVDGILVLVTGEKSIRAFQYSSGSILESTKTLRVRDQFGLEDISGGSNLREGLGIVERPNSISTAHTYNLRNQTWAAPRRARAGDFDPGIGDPISQFKDRSGKYPSNADAVTYALGPWLEDGDSEDSFLVDDLIRNPPGNFPAAKGYFIIDALERGSSRLTQINKLYSEYSELEHPISSVPTDKTPGGPTCVEEFAGRVWYAGLSGEIIDGDGQSPKMSSYVFYSQLVEDQSDIAKCYQEGDPTSPENSDLVDTDGGFIRVDGAYNIQKLIGVGTALMVIAENGVWMITGGSDYGFSATNNLRKKLSENGANSPGSVVVVENTVLFWADDAIYHIAPDKFGDFQAQNLTQTTIQTFYDDILPVDKLYAQGSYDSYERKARWVYQNRLQNANESRELILDMTLGAFYTSTLGQVGGSSYPKVASPIEIPPFRITSTQNDVINDGVSVVNDGEQVTQELAVRGQGTKETAYLTITDINPVKYTFSTYRDIGFVDWISEDGVGVDAPAFLITGYMAGGDFLRDKQVPYVSFHFLRTETGFSELSDGNLVPQNPSSCKVQAQWDWTDSAASNRWGREFEAYRYRRLYSPSGPADEFDNGRLVLTTRNKLRGKGKVLSLKISTAPLNDCRLLGWSMIVGVTQNV